MMSNEFGCLLTLPGTPDEQAYIQERLETLSVRERCALTALQQYQPSKSMADVVGHLCILDRCRICFPARNYEELARFQLSHEVRLPKDALPYVDLRKLGELYEEEYPGAFVGRCYVCRPTRQALITAPDQSELPPMDDTWSVKLKLASPAVPEGVWLRLPDVSGLAFEEAVEVGLALDALQVQKLDDCTLMEARCILPELGDLAEQYSSIEQLTMNGDTLGYLLGEMGREDMEQFAAALEYEDCRSLRFALDIAQNLRCYDYVPSSELISIAEKHLREGAVPEELIHSGCIDLKGYAEDLLETSGYMQTSGETGYIIRNGQEFVREYTAPEQGCMTMQ